MKIIWLLIILAFGSTTDLVGTPPNGFVDVQVYIPNVLVDSRYHSSDNFTQAPLPGYGVNKAWLRKEVVVALKKVQQSLEPLGLGLLIYDAYRPQRATQAMIAWAKRTDNWELINQGYIATRSRHNHGVAIDLTLVDLDAGTPLDMGTEWDSFSTESHTNNATGQVLENRMLLKQKMIDQGFTNYSKEWWHFNYKIANTRSRDVPYSCFEAKETKWIPPENWEKKQYNPPQDWPQEECIYQ
jgi:zinc D-Ala-D-Ala dipeptidase